MLARARAAGVTARHIRGFTVQPFVEGGTEVILGGMNDGKVGTLLMFGLGGVQVELLKDVAFRIHPVTDQDALEMVQEIKAFKLLDGYRGRPKSDVDAVVEFILRLNQLVTEVPGIVEMDLNPIKVFAKGQGAIVLDARIRLASA
jgi:acetyltransferase